MKRLVVASFLIMASLVFSMSSGPYSNPDIAFATTGGGPIVLDGMDPVCHSGFEGTWGYIAQVLKKTHDSVSSVNNGSIAILGANGTNNSCGGNWNTLLSTKYLTQFTTAPTVNFYNTAAEVTSFFSSINTIKPAVIWIPDNWARQPGVESVLTTNAEVIADFVNSGGGLFANMGSYGWLTALLPTATYNNGGCNGGPIATADGLADFGLTNAMVEACWHGYFTGTFGTLKTLAQWRYPNASTSPYASVSIGGGEVSLPSSFTIGITPENPNAGEDLTITATAQTLAGVPQAGVVVTVTVSAGPDAGQTFTATTNASGIATITVRTSSTGSATYTATATVNGVAKTVSTTVTWNPPTTTVAPSTTEAPSTTIAPTTTQVPAPSTTQVEVSPQTSLLPTTSEPPATTEIVTTTTHDHSSHSHGPLPNTGSSSQNLFLYSVYLILFGFFIHSLIPFIVRGYKKWKP